MIDLQVGPERVLVMAVQTDQYSPEQFQVILDEMTSLTETAGGQVIEVVTQKLPKLDGRMAVGSGKLEEIAAIVEAREIDLVISLNALTPSMNRQLEASLKVQVIDRVQLILDIFAMRARSREGKLQVALAQYNYLLPRLYGQGKHLSRQGGGIGTRGPGETKLESDRRHIRSVIHHVKEELADIAAHRERTRSRRAQGGHWQVGLVGYTNAGKSTLLTQLTQSETYVQDQLFATLDPLTRRMPLKGEDRFTLTDTVGFIEELPTELIHAFKSTLEEIGGMDLLLHVVDASDPAQTLHEQTVLRIIKELGYGHLPVLTVYNKIDCLALGQSVQATAFPSIAISAYELSHIDRLKQEIWKLLVADADWVDQRIPAHEAYKVAGMRQELLVTKFDYDENTGDYHLQGYRRRQQDREEETH
ncbi:GTPase HflX [uncultured Abiotrophia sp.]|uniref:GTPase HflX n=1 Tax=uncultured Abiotrophia sp. TaxID=316094 RepID=UPI0028D345AE|nr:GTPase HflX [uncultured Abiotrophia sp.]